MTEIKKRNWAFICYPESLPENWVEMLSLKGVVCAISPLHDRDTYDRDSDDHKKGDIKKPHYHVIVSYGNPTTYNNVLSLCKELNATIPVPLESVKGMYRYLTHRDNPEKAQYNQADIKLLNGFDPSLILSGSDIACIMNRIHLFILENDIIEYSDLVDLLACGEDTDMYYVSMNKTLFLNNYISSRRYKKEKKEKMS